MAQREALQKIQEYATKAHGRQDHVVDYDASGTEARLAQTVKELQARVQEQQAALDRVRVRLLFSDTASCSPVPVAGGIQC